MKNENKEIKMTNDKKNKTNNRRDFLSILDYNRYCIGLIVNIRNRIRGLYYHIRSLLVYPTNFKFNENASLKNQRERYWDLNGFHGRKICEEFQRFSGCWEWSLDFRFRFLFFPPFLLHYYYYTGRSFETFACVDSRKAFL